jgi:cytochrome c oxidase cbb3-type subunit 3
MRAYLFTAAATLGLAASLLAGCKLPGRPDPGPEVPRPSQVLSFNELYGTNCAGCHGANGQHGAATNLANPEYEALIDNATLRNVVANGEKGTLMPAFGPLAGGGLTDQQIDIIVAGMRQNWGRPQAFGGATPPPCHATGAGDAAQGQAVYTAACARCHGATAQQPGPAGSILDGSFLALINAQTLRTTILAGRPDLGQPDWRGDIPGHPLTDAEVTNLTAWLIAQTPAYPGRPYPSMQPNSDQPGEQQPLSEQK